MRFDAYKKLLSEAKNAKTLDEEIRSWCEQPPIIEFMKLLRDRLIILDGDEVMRAAEKEPDASWETVHIKHKTLKLVGRLIESHINLQTTKEKKDASTG